MSKQLMEPQPQFPTHSVFVGYLCWLVGGFIGAHRFYFGKRLTGIIWLFTFGLLGIGWLIDAFLIPSMARSAETRFAHGNVDYTVAWLLVTYAGPLGFHRFYMGKPWTALLWLCTAGLLGIGWVYDFLTLNQQVSDINERFQASLRNHA